jgi:crotonobetainyl-CoA:carnitine CoA-transferase CaiB-like acyl-CoA transferase
VSRCGHDAKHCTRLRALEGVRVLECAHYIAGPRCAQILADHGAEVVKLEPPTGDLSRRSAPRRDGWSLYFAAHNRRKQSVVVDLKHPESAAILERLIRWAEVIVTNFTPGATERLGLDFASASRVNPRVVVVRITAYGSTGAGRDTPGFDGTIQAQSGLAHMNGAEEGPPTVASLPLTDYLAAVEGALGAVLALRRRDTTGEGQEVDVSMMDASTTVLGYLLAEVLAFGAQPKRSGNRAPYALTGAFATQDGYVYIAPMGDPAWKALCQLIGREEWAQPDARYADADLRLQDRNLIEAAIGAWTRRLPTGQVVAQLVQDGVPCGPVRSIAEVASDPGLVERRMLQEVRLGAEGRTVPMPGTEIKLAGVLPDGEVPVVPRLGADTRDVLRRLGLDGDELERLKTAGAVVW